MPEPSAFIAELEERIEQLAEQAGRGRTVEVLAKAIITVGFLLLAGKLFGLAFASPLTWIVGAAAVLGGAVLYGSNRSTLDAMSKEMQDYQARRDEIIDLLHPREVATGQDGVRRQIGAASNQ